MTDLIDEIPLYQLAERVDAWVKTPEGKAAMEKTQKDILEMLREADDPRKIPQSLLDMRVTI